jgi:hypothetical protein
MLTVKAIYDGKKLKFLDKVSIKKPTNVLVTFLDDESDSEIANEDLLRLAEKGGAFDFLNDPEEDIYTDDDLKVRYK